MPPRNVISSPLVLPSGKKRIAWFDFPEHAWGVTRIVFGHWSQLGLIVLPGLVSLDTGCIWGRQLTAVRLDRRVPRVYQVPGQDSNHNLGPD